MKSLNYDWKRKETYPKSNGLKVFGTFVCGAKEGEPCLKYADARYRGLNTLNAFFSTRILYDNEAAPTLTSSGESIYWEEQRNLNDTEYCRMSTFPSDFDFCNAKVRYVCGMSVPPMMTAKIVEQIKTQWLNSSLNKL